MDMDNILHRYMRNAEVSRWLFSTEPLTTVTPHHLEECFVYSIGIGNTKLKMPDSMNIEDMLIVTATSGTFVMGVIWGFGQPHLFARTPMMAGAHPISRHFAVDLSPRDALEFMEFDVFDNGRVIVAFRRFLHTRDGSLPCLVNISLHDPSTVKNTLGPVIMKANLLEAASCPACGHVGSACFCNFNDSYAPFAPVGRQTVTWGHFTSQFMNKSRIGTVRFNIWAVLAKFGQVPVASQSLHVVNVLQKGKTKYLDLLRRKAVQGLGVTVVVPRSESYVLSYADENDYVQLHDQYVARKRARVNDLCTILHPDDHDDDIHGQLDNYGNNNLSQNGYDDFSSSPHGDGSIISYDPGVGNKQTSKQEALSVTFLPSTSSSYHTPMQSCNESPASVFVVPHRSAPTGNSHYKSENSGPNDVKSMKTTAPVSPPPPHSPSLSFPNKSSDGLLGSSALSQTPLFDTSTICPPPVENHPLSPRILNEIEHIILPPSQANENVSASLQQGNALPPLCSLTNGDFDDVKHCSPAESLESRQSQSRPSVAEDGLTNCGHPDEKKEHQGSNKASVARRTKRKAIVTAPAAVVNHSGEDGEVDDEEDDDRKHVCTQCSSKFKMRGDLLRHVKIVHEGKKMFTCQYCQKKFGHSGHLNRHVQSVHLHQRRFKCHLCGFQFYQASHRESHINHIHRDKRGVTCQNCGVDFKNQATLRTHAAQCTAIKTNSTGAAISAPRADGGNDAGFVCSSKDCDLTFGSEEEMKAHVVMVHSYIGQRLGNTCVVSSGITS